MKKSAVLSVLILGLLGALAATPAFASSTLYTTLGPGGAFDSSSGWLVEGSDYSYQAVAEPFSLSSGATVADAVLALGNYEGADNPVSVYIDSDSSGSPGGILATLTQVGTILPWGSGSGSGLVTFTCSGSGCNLGPGAYWLAAVETDPGTGQAWDMAYDDRTANFSYNATGSATGPWNTYPTEDAAFQIDGASGPVVPEPSSFLLLGSGLAGLAGLLKRQFRA